MDIEIIGRAMKRSLPYIGLAVLFLIVGGAETLSDIVLDFSIAFLVGAVYELVDKKGFKTAGYMFLIVFLALGSYYTATSFDNILGYIQQGVNYMIGAVACYLYIKIKDFVIWVITRVIDKVC